MKAGAFLHGLIFYGFNKDENGRKVFDGAWPQVDGRMMVMNIRWGQPNNLMYLYMGGNEAPVWWADYPNLARGLPANGMLHRCAQTNTCPEILETFASAELYSEKFSASLCGFTCIEDIPIPPMSIGTTRRVVRMAVARPTSTGLLPLRGRQRGHYGHANRVGRGASGHLCGLEPGHYRMVWAQCKQRSGKRLLLSRGMDRKRRGDEKNECSNRRSRP